MPRRTAADPEEDTFLADPRWRTGEALPRAQHDPATVWIAKGRQVDRGAKEQGVLHLDNEGGAQGAEDGALGQAGGTSQDHPGKAAHGSITRSFPKSPELF